ncbi:hypothetical protein CHLRE_04g221700v5 [Chlamydomonas reinhardtii]|uniref:Cytochrome c oxidase subunit 3 n=1 Tax=Chlamydomonas reinhardtii TaxID=3055 RepID=Q9FV97_CHLRE|nr:uncharacterized protein CHLRE_04g221700v5 [Chlamydomonas reinhardtii]AAG17279.1 cytochrome c oxidase subunit III [Chlamydomonas reinhardtii]AAK82666.1 cytochrome c oxidase subunit III [Chlamydomonas reinhardtii]PNW84118.1 hypothetical protein CHLRE_04g221700v5 [Chlamydomonas reinhardtii]BAB21505.1 cytochrome c oxidase subunit 3 [Chlamydomonas reinhardtii]|eukprot:XP_001692182.1 cytochrome c oxidase subunit III [Chlamydomonas reinhardtii]
MRSQLLRFLTRAPAGFSQEGLQALRAGLTSGEASGLLQSSAFGRQNESAAPRGLGFGKMALPLSFQGHLMSTLASANGDDKKEPTTGALAQQPQVPNALAALPPRGTRTMGSHAAGHQTAKEFYMEHIGKRHPFHVLPPSPWPMLAGWGTYVSCLGMAAWFHNMPTGGALMAFGMANIAWTAITWWRDCAIEGDMGMHTEVVRKNFISGMWAFIVSEALLFVGLLWACLHLGMSPSVALQMQWPPVGIEPIGWDKRALVMSAVLAASYYSANVAMVAKDPKVVMGALATTIGLGAMFLADQYLEYNETPFTITDSPYGTTFFVTTGFHGMHVLLGSLYLTAALMMYKRTHNAGAALKSSILYWHFVDIVWIAVYGIIYVGQY